MDTQTILTFILGILTINLIAVGIYVILVLKEFRETVKKANSVLDDVNSLTSLVGDPVKTIAGVVAGVTESIKAVKSISSLMDSKKREER